ncbi:MAG: sigma-70 family RNA polymerase sigma factor [Bacteroidales bacterium]|nr:sigma-70 family RNA polymerase sigma factor [Bacteroidales bacterium]MBQ8811982.1 sigma-70 family RNA polymerase sigma factor [Bacteroidales bacterium]
MRNYIAEIVTGDMKAFDELYKAYRMQFIAYMRLTQGLGSEDAVDLYQDVCSALLNNVKTGRLKEDSLPDSSLRSYINKTGLFILYNRRRKKAIPLTFDTDKIVNLDDKVPDEDNTEMEDKLFIVRKAVELMPMPCSQLLELRFFKEKKGKDIARIMNYANPDSVKTQVNKCKAKLKEIIVKRFRECGYDEV